jgi:hypothetical protein
MSEKKNEAQTICDVLMECLHQVKEGNAPKDREAMYDWVRERLRGRGIEGGPVGMSHFHLKYRLPDPNPLVDEVRYLNAVVCGQDERIQALGEIIQGQTAALALFTKHPHIVTGLNRKDPP